MSKPTVSEISRLEKYKNESDDEAYHGEFDCILEEKLMQLDPEWMKAMNKLYEDSEMNRWCA